MGLLDFRRKWREEEKAEEEKLKIVLQNLGLYEEADYETVRDGIEKIKTQSKISKAVDFDPTIAPSYTKRDRGINASAVIDQWYDHQTNPAQFDMNKAIEKLGKREYTQKESKARNVLQAFISRNYFNYLYARKIFGIPMEHPTLRPWYADYLNRIPNLINPGGEISLLEGRYTINATITIAKSDVSMKGLGMSNTEVYIANGSNCDAITIGDNTNPYSHVALSNFKINGNKANQTSGNGIKGHGKVYDVLLEKLYILDADDFAIAYTTYDNTKKSGRIKLKESVMESSDSIGVGFSFSEEYIKVYDNYFITTGDNALVLASDYNIINHNYFLTCEHNSINAATGDGCKDFIISDNYIDGAGDDGIQPYENVANVIIANNMVKNSARAPTGGDLTAAGIKIGEGAGSNITYCTVLGNHSFDDQGVATQDKGIWIADASVDSCLVIGNTVYNNIQNQILDSGTTSIIKDNPGYNPVGGANIGVGASPFTYTAGSSPETVYIRGGTVNPITIGGRTLFVDTGHSIDLPPYVAVVVTYTDVPTMEKYVH